MHRDGTNSDAAPPPRSDGRGQSPTVGAGVASADSEQITAQARQRYHAHLVAAFGARGFADGDGLADVALDALTEWRDVDTGEVCRCSCHPHLPTNNRHDFGFDCLCTKTRAERKRVFDSFRSDIKTFWNSPEGQAITAANRAEKADLDEWVAAQPDVTMHSDSDFGPESWHGEVAGHRFYFRERWGEWHIELDLRPSGRYVQSVVAVEATGGPRIEPRETEVGDVIARGDTTEDGYGTTRRERAQFIVGKIRQHLVRASCALHTGDLLAVEAILGDKVRWCPACGTSVKR